MPTATPVPVELVGLGTSMWAYLDKVEDAYRLALFFAGLSVFVAVVLGTALVITSGLRR